MTQITTPHVMENLPFAHVGLQRALNSIILKYREGSENILNKSRDIGSKNGVKVKTVLPLSLLIIVRKKIMIPLLWDDEEWVS